VTIQLDSPLNLEAGPDTLVCNTGAYKLTATSEGGNEFKWSTDRDFTDVISDELEVEIELVPGGQYYYVMGTNENGCTEVDSVFVGSGLIDASLPEEVLVCDATEAAEITVENAMPEQELSYLWMPEDKIGSDPIEGPTATLVPGAEGDISVFLENQYGCTLELSTTVVLEDLSSATISSDRDTIFLDETVQIMVDSCEGCNFDWEPADLVNNPMAGSVIAEPTETTTFSVTVERNGCERTLSKTIVVIDLPCDVENIFIPRAFTPNGDGENDVLFVRTNIIDEEAELHFIIYSSWGQEVYDGRSLDEGWDGTFRGRALPPDVYGYFFEGRCLNGEVIRVQGNVTLLR
jgi:gliding motility-associated-like protein